MKCSNNLVGLVNFLSLIISIPILGAGIWLAHKAHTDCERFLEKPVLAVGVILLLISLAGLAGSCCKVNWLLWLYLVVMFVLIVVLFCFTVFAFVVTNKGAGEALSGKGYKDYHLGDYSHWLQKRVNSTKNWDKIRSCLIDAKVCQSLSQENQTTASQFYAQNLSPIQSGCCKPPTDCDFQYAAPTVWNAVANTNSTDPDCSLWSNSPSELCFNCESCKAGVLQNIKSDWKKVAIVNIIFLIFLIIVYSVGCCAFRNNRMADYRWKPYP
ncbi:Tetraspanin-8 [Dionaea muscipula]